jgi:hypothetical protein
MLDPALYSEQEQDTIVAEQIQRQQRLEGSWEFYRVEMRHTIKSRILDCHHTIGRGDPYRYSVGKVWNVPGLIQTLICDVCMRHGNKY